MFGTKRKLQLGGIAISILSFSSLCQAQNAEEIRALRYLIASENKRISEAIVNLLDTYNLVLAEGISLRPPEQFDFIFIQKKRAIVEVKILGDALSGIEGDVKGQLLEATSESNERYIETFDIVGGWSLTVVISTTATDLAKSLQCSTVGLSYHVIERVPADLSQNWQTTYIELLTNSAAK